VKIIAVVGSESGSGKTTVACRIFRAIPGLGAVKISPREGEARAEWGAGTADKDTGGYAASGAAVIARIIGPRNSVAVTWGKIRENFRACRAVVMEGRGAIDLPGEKFVIFTVGPGMSERPDRTSLIAARSDMIIVMRPTVDAVLPPILSLPPHFLPGVPVLDSSLGARDDHGDEEIVRRVQRFIR
jgi:hypothetical protein